MSVAEQTHDPEETAADRETGSQAQLTVFVRHEPEAMYVTVAGDVDLLTAPRLAAALGEIPGSNVRHIAIDLTETTFMDSAGIHILVQMQQRAMGHVAVICGPGPVLRALELLGLAEPLNVVSSLNEYKLSRSGS
jgi:anti-sigma B factor antagonist